MEAFVLLAFVAILLGCVGFGAPVLYALLAGYALFFGYGLARGVPARRLLRLSLAGIRTVKNILLLFVWIGMLTALWRGAGTVAVIVSYAAGFLRPSVVLLMCFLLNCLVSLLTGTSFGTVATMGVICMSIARTMGISPVLAGGAILSGIFFGDRASPISTSALLVAELTKTDIHRNVRRMFASALVPFLAACAVYAAAGFLTRSGAAAAADPAALFAGGLRLHWTALIPAVLILLLSLLRVDVGKTLLASIAAAAVLCMALQGMELPALLRSLLFGYRSADPALAAVLDGGGVASMLNVAAIVCLSSCYAGLFAGTGLLEPVKRRILSLGNRTSAFGAILATSALTSLVACNQTLTIVLTHQLCETLEPDAEALALDLEDSAVVLAPLVPWSIAGAVPIAAIGAPPVCLLAACYLYLLPAWRLLRTALRARGDQRRAR